jgi:hypothetical protein
MGQEEIMAEKSINITEEHDCGNCSEEPVEEIPSRIPSEEERYFYEQSYREPVESIARIEEVAKFMVGATATTSGLFLAAFKLSTGSPIPGRRLSSEHANTNFAGSL